MHSVAFKKAIIEAFLAGADSMYCGCYNRQTRVDAKEWFDNEYGQQQSEDCDCCEEE